MNWRAVADRNRVFAVLALAAVVVLTGPVPVMSAATRPGVDGRLVSGGEPVTGGRVSAFGSIDLEAEPLALSSPSGPDGRYSLDLAPGTYYLAASEGNRWSWCGLNPVTVTPAERQWIGFALTSWSEPEFHPAGEQGAEGAISGRVLRNGMPQEDVTVSLYFDETEGFRGMAFMRTAPTGQDGYFRMEMVPEGSYYVIARKRGSGLGVGPMVKGDLISWYRHNPLRVQAGKEARIVLPLVSKRLDRDLHGADPSGESPGFTGVITDEGGLPVRGVHVFAYLNPEMGHHKPAALSSVTDERGRYHIYLPDAGRYYVGARQGYGDNPSPGEMFGHYEGTPDHSLTLREGQRLEGIDMVVRKVLAP